MDLSNQIDKNNKTKQSVEDISKALLLSSSNNLNKPEEGDSIKKEIYKSHNHDHFWIEDEVLYESYNTLRGMRFREIFEVPNHKDCDRVSDKQIKQIITEVLNSK